MLYENIIKEKLQSSKGIENNKKRSIEIESVFGNIKNNMGFRRFTRTSLISVYIEFGLITIAHNLKKMLKFIQ